MDFFTNAATRARNAIVAAIAILFVMAGPAPAQWLKLPLAGTPRTPDGKPNPTAPAPKTPDGKPNFSGIWNNANGKYLRSLAVDQGEAPFQAWAAAVYKERQESQGKDRPSGHCLPHGVPDAMLVRGYPWKIVQTPEITVVLYEEHNHYRQIFTDGRALPADQNPTWFGYSVGKWEGDTLVVETTGFNEESWLDDGGHPHSDALHVTERFRRRDFGHLDIQFTIDDQKAYTKSWGATVGFELLPDTELIENICENEKDAAHLVGK